MNRDPTVVSYTMSHIHGKNTKPEVLVRKYLFSRGLRFRVNDKRYPGKPDIVLPKYHAIVFINGCFWHMHENHPCFKMPSTHESYWVSKLMNNRRRDNEHQVQLEALGWRVLIVWECELKAKLYEDRLAELYKQIVCEQQTNS